MVWESSKEDVKDFLFSANQTNGLPSTTEYWFGGNGAKWKLSKIICIKWKWDKLFIVEP